ncbi:MAG TPA: AAA family ATPase [Candidatus Acidoferrales bacterium]|nr:AAA family ATPase [Candidatus Acidoferrales bacterium]
MLKISEIKITNFRSIHDENFHLRPLTVLIGKNDVGKSNLLEAIRILLEGTAGSVDTEDFYDEALPLEISAILEDVRPYLDLCDERTKPKIEKRIDEFGRLRIRRQAKGPKQLTDIEVEDPETRDFSPVAGISAPLKAMLPEVISIGALADVADQAKGTQKDALGQLVNQVLSGIVQKIEPKVQTAYEGADKILNVPRQGADERAPELIEIETELTKYLQQTFPRASVRLRVQLASIKEILDRVHVFVREGSNEDPYYRRGQGMQRTLYLSLLRAEADRIRTDQQIVRPYILLFEEPEAFLHPDGQSKMREALTTISAGAQVIAATHSPVMVRPDSLSSVIRVENCQKDGCQRPVTRGIGPIQTDNLTANQRQLMPLFSVQRSSRFLFARGVILVEGASDEHIFSAIAARIRGFRPEDYEVSIIESGGKDKFVAFAEILNSMGLEVWIVTDLDFLWNGAGEILQPDPAYSQFVQDLRELVPDPDDVSEAAKRAAKKRKTEACDRDPQAQRNALCEKLMMSNIFVLRHGEIEDYVGLTQNSKGQYLKAASEIRRGNQEILYREEFERILDALAVWAGPPAIQA